MILATDDTIFYVNVSTNVPKVIAKPFLHVTDVTLDGAYAYWLTRGAGATPGAVWKAPLK